MAAYGIMSAAPGVAQDAGSADTIAPTTEGAMAAAQARYSEHESDTLGQGSVLGDAMPLVPAPDIDTAILVTEPGGRI